jgi:hypothetical protein
MPIETAFEFKCAASKLAPQNTYTVVDGMYGIVKDSPHEHS